MHGRGHSACVTVRSGGGGDVTNDAELRVVAVGREHVVRSLHDTTVAYKQVVGDRSPHLRRVDEDVQVVLLEAA